MSYIVNVPFGNLNHYQSDLKTLRHDFSKTSIGARVEWGSNWTNNTSTEFIVGKIQIGISNLGLPNPLPANSKIQITLTSLNSYCGAGYLRGYITQNNYSQVTEVVTIDERGIHPNSSFDAGGACRSSYTWSNAANGAIIVFDGTTNDEFDTSKDLFIYIVDTNNNYSQPGRTVTKFEDTYFKVSITPSISALDAPSSLSIEATDKDQASSGLQVYYDDNITINWVAPNYTNENPIKGYNLYYKNQSAVTLFDTIGASAISYSYNTKSKIPSMKKGNEYSFGIQTLGIQQNTDSPIIFTNTIKVINKLPDKPFFTTTGNLNSNGTDSTITFTALQAYDADGDAIEYSYVVSDSEDEPSSNWKLASVGTSVVMNLKNPYLHVKAKDSMGWGGSSCKKISTKIPPDITINVSSNNFVKLSTGQKFARTLTIIPTISGIVSQIKSWNWKIGAGGLFKIVSVQQPTNIEVTEGTGGQIIKIVLDITDIDGDKFSYNFSTDYYKLYDLGEITTLNISPNETPHGIINSTYLSNNLKCQVACSELKQDDIDRKIVLYLGEKDSNNIWRYNRKLGETTANRNGGIVEFNFTHVFSYNIDYQFKAVLTDATGRISEGVVVGIYELLPKFNVTNFAFSQLEWSPLTLTKTATLEFSARNTDNTTEGTNYYKIEAKINNQTSILVEKIYRGYSDGTWSTRTDGSTIYFEIGNYALFSRLNVPTNAPTYNVQYIITGYNAFGVVGNSQIFYGTIITRHAPEFGNENALKISVNENTASGNTSLWVNPGETLTFALTNFPIDKNSTYLNGSEVITEKAVLHEYEVSYSYNKTSWNFLQKIGYNGKSFEITAPDLGVNGATKIYFRIRVKDDTDLYSNYLESNNFLYICRKVSPIINITGAQQDETNFTIDFEAIDFGGNERGLNNFKRMGIESYTITLKASEDNETFKESTTEGLVKNLSSSFSQTFSLSMESSNKLYLKAIVRIYTNTSGAFIETETTTFILFTDMPTMSHRAHWIGINTTDNIEKDVFHVSQFGDRKFIRLEGFTGNVEKILTINLATGEISGAIISGGTWE